MHSAQVSQEYPPLCLQQMNFPDEASSPGQVWPAVSLLQTKSEDVEENGNLSSDVGVFWMGNIGPKEPMFNNIVGLSSLSSLASFRTTGFGLGACEGLAVGLLVGFMGLLLSWPCCSALSNDFSSWWTSDAGISGEVMLAPSSSLPRSSVRLAGHTHPGLSMGQHVPDELVQMQRGGSKSSLSLHPGLSPQNASQGYMFG